MLFLLAILFRTRVASAPDNESLNITTSYIAAVVGAEPPEEAPIC